ncbi:unnamed protein product, partial [Oppiella nova]
LVEESLAYLGIDEAVWQKSNNNNYYNISFAVDLEDSDAVIQYFKSRGVGSKMGSSIGENGEKDTMRKLSNFKALQSSFLKSVTARLTVAQVVDNVRSGASLTFDFVCYLIFASWIAAMGLLDNSVVSLVASMLVSPMMGPVMAMTFGTIIKDGSLRRLGFRNLGVCFAITILFGYFFGIIALNFTKHWNGDQEWPTNMMRERGLPRVAWVGTLVAFPSGCAVAISLLSGNEASLVGVAISVSLLPPAVNAGLLWAFATLKTLYSIGESPEDKCYYSLGNLTKPRCYNNMRPSLRPEEFYIPFHNDNIAIETAILGAYSLILSLINITNIFIGALILLKIKEIAPLSTMSPNTRRFFQEDIKLVEESLAYLGIDEAVWQKSNNNNYYNISFAVDLEDSDAVIQYFKSRGVGSKMGSSIGIIPFSLYCYEEESDPLDEIELNENGEKDTMRKLSNFKALQSSFLKSVTARLTVAQ